MGNSGLIGDSELVDILLGRGRTTRVGEDGVVRDPEVNADSESNSGLEDEGGGGGMCVVVAAEEEEEVGAAS